MGKQNFLSSLKRLLALDNPSANQETQKRFKIALSFPGEQRDFVRQVAEYLADKLESKYVLYDEYYVAEFARPNLSTYLQSLYHDQSDLIAVFLCADYERKDWCSLEWRVILDLIHRRETSAIMPLRFDDTEIPGIFSLDGYVWIDKHSPKEIADTILKRYQLNSNEFLSTVQDNVKEKNIENNPLPTTHKNHLQFQNQIRIKITEELAKDILKPLREGFIEIIWNKEGKVGTPSLPELINELFPTEKTTEYVDPEAMLQILLRATEISLNQLEALGEKISEDHIVWKTAKQMLGWLTTLAVRSEELVNSDINIVFDTIDVETLIGVEVYTARKKEIPAAFQTDNTKNSAENLQCGNPIIYEFLPETGWQIPDVISQIGLIIWKAAGYRERREPLTEEEWKRLDKTLVLHQTRSRNCLNYYLSVNKDGKNNPLLSSEVCRQLKVKLHDLTIVHVGTETNNGTLLVISEGVLIALIEEFLSLIDRYQ